MSPLRITTLVVAAVLTAAGIIALVDYAIKGDGAALASPLMLALTCAALAAWLAFVAITVRDAVCERLNHIGKQAGRRLDERDKHVNERFDELAGQIAAIAEMVGEYGDQREARGYLAGVHDTNSPGHLTRVK